MISEGTKQKVKNDLKKGREHEILFIKTAIYRGYDASKSDENTEDWEEHWDVLLYLTDIPDYVDVKSDKEGHKHGYTWVELKNVNGNIGWLYAPKMTILAFEFENYFALVRRLDLIPIVEKNLKIVEEEYGVGLFYDKNIVLNYQRYCRKNWGRSDQIVKVPIKDFEHLIFKIIEKI